MTNAVYRFEDCELDLHRFQLRRGGEVIHVEPQVLDVLVHLVAHRDRLVPKAELLDVVWGDRFVSESALTSRLKEARRAVGDDGQQQRGSRRCTAAATASSRRRGRHERCRPVPPSTPPEGRTLLTGHPLLRSGDGVCVAYATAGNGPPLVKAANWLTHLELDWESPIWGHWLHGLAGTGN